MGHAEVGEVAELLVCRFQGVVPWLWEFGILTTPRICSVLVIKVSDQGRDMASATGWMHVPRQPALFSKLKSHWFIILW